MCGNGLSKHKDPDSNGANAYLKIARFARTFRTENKCLNSKHEALPNQMYSNSFVYLKQILLLTYAALRSDQVTGKSYAGTRTQKVTITSRQAKHWIAGSRSEVNPMRRGKPKRFVTISWRSKWFSFWGYHSGLENGTLASGKNSSSAANVTSSSAITGRAFFEVYRTSLGGLTIVTPAVGKYFGDVIPPSFTTDEQTIMLHFYIEAPPTSSNTAMNGTNNSTSANQASGNTYFGPYINFTADVTSYFIGQLQTIFNHSFDLHQ